MTQVLSVTEDATCGIPSQPSSLMSALEEMRSQSESLCHPPLCCGERALRHRGRALPLPGVELCGVGHLP